MEHFIQFLKILDLDLSLNYDLGIQTLIVIVFTSLLLDGATIKGLVPRKGTMEGYLTAETKYSINVCNQDITLDPDPRLPRSQWKTHRMLKYIKQYQSKLKGKQNKKDPLTKRMILWLQKMGDLSHHNNHNTAIVDWLILGLTTACQGIKWCQPADPEGLKNKKLRGLQLYKQDVEHTKIKSKIGRAHV